MSFAKPKAFETSLQDKILGIVVLTAIALVIYAIYLNRVSAPQHSMKFELRAHVNQTYGIVEDSPVTLSGVLIGKVSRVELTPSGQVEIRMQLDGSYRSFYRKDSVIQIDSKLGLSTVISGSGLTFIPSQNTNNLLGHKSLVKVIEPKSFEELIEQWQVEKIASQLTSIVDSLAAITQTIEQNQQHIAASLQQADQLTASLQQSAAVLPNAIQQFDKSLQQIELLTGQLGQTAAELERPIIQALNQVESAAKRGESAIQTAELTLTDLPRLMDEVEYTLISSRKLMHTLDNHWLLKSTSEQKVNFPLHNNLIDDRLYNSNPSN
ncbi:MlaD family protein [Catenovulum agarivorans]|uniref:MlaD family protein n=1 Tax=Catenovulum agarivorans TaxID=1172192 RepID=UPI0002F24015|nr:MlaD family protein [Catenovulum agarivorans]